MSATERTTTLTGTWKNGQVILDGPADWPEGCRVIVEPIPDPVETLGITKEDWPTTPGAIAEWLEWFDSIKPIEMAPREEAEWHEWRQKVKEYTIANMNKGIAGLFE